MDGNIPALRGRSCVAAGVVAAVSIATGTSAWAHDVGVHVNAYNQDGLCLEGRNVLEDSHINNLPGAYYEAHSDMSATTFGLCFGNPAVVQPAGWLAAPHQFWVNDHERGWVMCDPQYNTSTSATASVSVTRDWGKWVPCVDNRDKRVKQTQVWTGHFFYENGQWKGTPEVRSGYHYFHNQER